MPPEDFARVKSLLISAIPESVETGHRQSLQKRITFANEYSFIKRLTTLIKGLTEDARNIVCNNRDNFAKGIVSTRNYLTHYSDDPDTVPLEGDDKYCAYEKLLMLLRLLHLRYVGIPESQITAHVTLHHIIKQQVTQYKTATECMLVP